MEWGPKLFIIPRQYDDVLAGRAAIYVDLFHQEADLFFRFLIRCLFTKGFHLSADWFLRRRICP